MPKALSVEELKDKLLDMLIDDVHLSYSVISKEISIRAITKDREFFKKQKKVVDEMTKLCISNGYEMNYDDTDVSPNMYYQAVRFNVVEAK